MIVKPKVSLIIPVYNTQEYLRECLESAIKQTLKEIEIVCVNDGSPDNSNEILEEYSKKDSRIIIVNQKNQGVSVARNNGIIHASGNYIFCLDSDDTIDDNFLKSSYEKAIKENADVVLLGKPYFNKKAKTFFGISTCQIFLEKKLITKYEIKYPRSIQWCEDTIFSLFAISVATKIVVNNDAKYVYRQHKNSHHIGVLKNPRKILTQIPLWFDVIATFYNRTKLWDSKVLNIMFFIQLDVYKRLVNWEFNKDEKRYLFLLIKDFYNKNLRDKIKKSDYKFFEQGFILLLNSNSYWQFVIKIFIYSFIQNIFSIKNEYSKKNKYKVITILGIKMKFEKPHNLEDE